MIFRENPLQQLNGNKMLKDDAFWMNQAFQLALQAKAEGEVPIGAVLISETDELLGSGYNKVIQTQDPTAHAEIFAIRNAAKKVNNYRLLNTTLYVTLEPCCMCAGALVHARIERLVFATRDFKAGAAGSICNLLQGFPLNHKVKIDEGVMQEECANLLSQFFTHQR